MISFEIFPNNVINPATDTNNSQGLLVICHFALGDVEILSRSKFDKLKEPASYLRRGAVDIRPDSAYISLALSALHRGRYFRC